MWLVLLGLAWVVTCVILESVNAKKRRPLEALVKFGDGSYTYVPVESPWIPKIVVTHHRTGLPVVCERRETLTEAWHYREQSNPIAD